MVLDKNNAISNKVRVTGIRRPRKRILYTFQCKRSGVMSLELKEKVSNKAIETVGLVGSSCLALCAAPETYLAITKGKTDLSYLFLIMWLVGEILLLIYTFIKSKQVRLRPLFFNYGTNIIFISIIIYIKAKQ